MNKKLRKVLYTLIVILLLLIASMLAFLFYNHGDDTPPTEPTDTTAVTEATESEATQAPTEMPTEAPTEPEITEAPTEATEPEETDPTEEATSPPTEPPATKPEDTDVDKATYVTVNETVYATISLNVRTGPGTKYEKVGFLKFGEAVQRTAIGSYGWSKVMFNGKEAYVSSMYLSTTDPTLEDSPATEPPATGSPATEPPATESEMTPPSSTEAPHQHSYEAAGTVAPTCTKEGYTTYKCSCGDSYAGDKKSATGHSWGDWATTKEPTTDAEGEKARKCGSCSTSETQAIAKLTSSETNG